jgi:hypothetical protein
VNRCVTPLEVSNVDNDTSNRHGGAEVLGTVGVTTAVISSRGLARPLANGKVADEIAPVPIVYVVAVPINVPVAL